jgi:hypothetical protein
LVVADLEIGTISITYEPCITRVFSSKESARTEKFRNQVRERDGKCVAGTVNTGAYGDFWWRFEAAHIFHSLRDNYLWIQVFIVGLRIERERVTPGFTLVRMDYLCSLVSIRGLIAFVSPSMPMIIIR